MIKDYLKKVVSGESLTETEAFDAMNAIMSGEATDAQIASFITALRMKGETVEEITGFARIMREKAVKVIPKQTMLVDTCGTGGDQSYSFNISTTVAFVLAGAGVPVAKHGNRSVSSKSGSADVLEALGVNLNITPEAMASCIDEVGIGFLYAPALHGAMKYAVGPRKEIGIRTVFNILGPLTNPAGAQAQVLGVYDPVLTEVIAEVLAGLGTNTAFVVNGAGSMDEASLAGPTKVTSLVDGQIKTFYIEPEDLGLQKSSNDMLKGGDAQVNASITREILKGEKGPRRDVVLLNAALGLVAGGKAEDIREGIEIAARSIDTGAALTRLEHLAEYTNNLARCF